MISSNTTRKGSGPHEPPWATWVTSIRWVCLSSQWNGLSAYGDVWWEAGLMVPLDGNGCPECKMVCMGGFIHRMYLSPPLGPSPRRLGPRVSRKKSWMDGWTESGVAGVGRWMGG